MVVKSVLGDGPAAKGGLMKGTRSVESGMRAIASVKDVAHVLNSRPEGDEVKFTIRRDRKERIITLNSRERPVIARMMLLMAVIPLMLSPAQGR